MSEQLRQREETLRQARTEQHVVEAALTGHNQRLTTLRQEAAALKQQVHEQQMESLRLSQGLERFQERSRQIQLELDEIARQQEAKGFELGAAVSLARLLGERGRRDEARELLAPVYGWFTEGFDTPDLVEAKALIDELS